MHLSLLEVDSRSHIARTWLGNPYRVHQRLLMAFPNADPGRVLFRIEDEWALPRIIVQSEAEAEWDAAFGDFTVLASPVQQKTCLPIPPSVFRPRVRVRRWTGPGWDCSRRRISALGWSARREVRASSFCLSTCVR
jgi:hypothetical protein